MRSFAYKAVREDGKIVTGTSPAEDVATLERDLKHRGLFLLETLTNTKKPVARRRGRVSTRQLTAFTYELAIAVDAGVPIVSALQSVNEDALGAGLASAVKAITAAVKDGESLADALSRHPNVFDELYVSLVAAGEKSGKLDHVLRDLVSDLEWREELKSQARQATIYPIFLITSLIGLVGFLMAFVLPKFFQLFIDMEVELPLLTRALIAISDAVRGGWYIFGFVICIGVLAWRAARRNPEVSCRIEQALLALPILGDLRMKLALARFARTFALLIRSGVGIPSALTMLQRVVANPVLAGEIANARTRIVDDGMRIAGAFTMSGRFPPLVLSMLQVGESTGSLDETMGKVGTYYGNEVPASVKRLLTVFEPAMLLAVAAVIGIVVLSIYLPIFEISNLVEIQVQ